MRAYETVDKYKVILIIKGLKEQEGVNYFNSYTCAKDKFYTNFNSHLRH